MNLIFQSSQIILSLITGSSTIKDGSLQYDFLKGFIEIVLLKSTLEKYVLIMF